MRLFCTIMVFAIFVQNGVWAGQNGAVTGLADQVFGHAPDFPSAPYFNNPVYFIFILFVMLAVLSVMHLRERKRWEIREQEQEQDIIALRQQVDQAEALMFGERQLLVVYDADEDAPIVEGDLSLALETPVASRLLAFGLWLKPKSAQALQGSVDALREEGKAFAIEVATTHGKYLLIDGSTYAGRAILRMRDITGVRLELVKIQQQLDESGRKQALHDLLLDHARAYVWMRSTKGKLIKVNPAYARAVDVALPQDALKSGVELLDRAIRESAMQCHEQGKPFSHKAHAMVGSQRHLLDILEVANDFGTLGLAYDLHEQETLRAQIELLQTSHRRTLDQLTTAVAIFDKSMQLVFYNAAYAQLWQLDKAYLDNRPLDGEILDRLRLERKLPEQQDYRKWQSEHLSCYQALETAQFPWYLPQGKILRVVISPNAQGGVTYLFDDTTHYVQLEQKYNGLLRMQSETLDTLKEGVGVFGSNGRLKLYNVSFMELWRLKADDLSALPHVDAVVKLMEPQLRDVAFCKDISLAITGLYDQRVGFERELQRHDGTVLDCRVAPLPDGGTLVTFSDVTAKVSVERALTERNEALLAAERLRSNFLHHVSYELRTPLTNVLGFIQFLNDETVGSLNERQRAYVNHVMTSTMALYAIINDILDLATIDAGAMELSPSSLNVRSVIETALEGLADRVIEGNYHIEVFVPDDVVSFEADGKRVRQVLFNILSNAIGFSKPGATIAVAAMQLGEELVFKVTDEGRGMSPQVLAKVFERFETHSSGTRHRGLGIGLSIVRSLVELHGGRVLIDSVENQGTSVTCIFPMKAITKPMLKAS